MKKHFPGHFPQSKAQIKKLWKSCFFVVDANILLNLYRYSDETKAEFLDVLDSVKKRLWLPHRAAEEFFDNRLTVIGKQEKAYVDARGRIAKLQEDLANARQHPFVSDATMKIVLPVLERLTSELSKNQEVHTKRITDDSIRTTVARIFAGRVGEAYDSERLSEIFKEGESRYAERIPPGFKDARKGDGSDRQSDCCRKYGDLLVWFQILEHAQEESMSVILVTDDKKEDWWQIFDGKTVGPRPELVQEFLSRTKQAFHMYQADRFLQFATEYLEQTIADTTLSEIREVQRRDMEVHQAKRLQRMEMVLREEYSALASSVQLLLGRRSSLTRKREKLLYQYRELEESTPSDTSDPEREEKLIAIQHQLRELEVQIDRTTAELSDVEDHQIRLQRQYRHHDGFIRQEATRNTVSEKDLVS